MTFQAYIDTIKDKTGLDPADFLRIAEEKGLLAADVKAQQIIDWLARDYDLGRGHAMAIVKIFDQTAASGAPKVDRVAQHFTGAKAHWRPVYDQLLDTLRAHGPVETAGTDSYVSLLKGKAKFAVVAVTADRMDIGIKLKDAEPDERFEQSGAWNVMVTHRVRLNSGDEIDGELLDWLRRAYDAA